MLSLLAFVSFLSGCADETPPTWEEGGAVSAEPGEERIRFTWPAASDDEGVDAYLLRIDGQVVARLGADASSYMAMELGEGAPHAFEVRAVDRAGNESDPLETTAFTLDTTPPVWTENASIYLTANGERDGPRLVHVAFSAAPDASHYLVLRNGEQIGTTDVAEEPYDVADQTLSDDDVYEVRAVDEAGNESVGLVARWGDTGQARSVRREQPQTDHAALAARRRAQMAATAERALLQILGSQPPGSITNDVLAGGAVHDDAADLMMQAEGVGVATGGAGGVRLRPQGGTGNLGAATTSD